MAYSITVERIGAVGTPIGAADHYETADEDDAVTVAAFAVETTEAEWRCVATVRDTAGRLIVSYAGRPKGPSR